MAPIGVGQRNDLRLWHNRIAREQGLCEGRHTAPALLTAHPNTLLARRTRHRTHH